MDTLERGTEILAHYAGQGNVARWIKIALVENPYRHEVRDPDAYPNPRIYIRGRDQVEDKLKSLRADRILEIADPVTGELGDLRTMLEQTGFAREVVRRTTPVDHDRFRTVEHDLEFDEETGALKGWYFHVPRAFAAALDLSRSEFATPSQGWPPAYGFNMGDTLYDSVEARRLPWGQALQHIGMMVEVDSAQADQPNKLKPVIPGEVHLTIRHVEHGQMLDPERYAVTQGELVHLLRTGEKPESSRRKL